MKNLDPYIFDDGERAYRLRKPPSACPAFDDPIDRATWKCGYYSTRDRVSKEAALATLRRELNMAQA
jgi:hypothetical protein